MDYRRNESVGLTVRWVAVAAVLPQQFTYHTWRKCTNFAGFLEAGEAGGEAGAARADCLPPRVAAKSHIPGRFSVYGGR